LSVSPTISVVVPVYNGASHIAAAVESIAGQSLKALEVIIVNDGSTDSSGAVIASVVEQYADRLEFTVITHDNVGQSASRNAASFLARGELLAFLDQDDRWYPEHLEVLAQAFEHDPLLGLAYSDFDEVDGAGNYVVRNYIAAHKIEHPKTTIIDWIASDAMILPSASLVRTAAFAEVAGFDPNLCGYEDDELWIRIFRAGWDTKFIRRSLTVFRVHSGSSSTRASFRESRVLFFRKMAAVLPDSAELRRFYMSDVLLPRLTRSALGEYLAALRTVNFDEARAVAATIDDLFKTSGSNLLRPRERWMLRRPGLVRRALRIRRAILSPIRDRLVPGRRLRHGYSEWAN
jgi:glycosyltransferase involved in cell wall biosynthesis